MKHIRNIAVIAHVDHGKTTLIDALLKQTNVFRDNEKEMNLQQILDTNDLERERGITILAKNCSIAYRDTKINIIDTPGHSDFSGEVERTLGMADGALLIIDAQEGPMPQTRFVLKKALELKLKIIVVINKIDKKNADLVLTERRIDDLFLELAVREDQLQFPKLFAVAREGKVFTKLPNDISSIGDVRPLLDLILEFIPAPKQEVAGDSFKLSVASLDYDDHLGRMSIGKIFSGSIAVGDKLILTRKPQKNYTVESLFEWQGLKRHSIPKAMVGEVVAIAGVSEAHIGDTLSDPTDSSSLPDIIISEPTLHIHMAANSSPFAGREGIYTTIRQIEERLDRELESNLSLQVEKGNGQYKISGRGELHLSILLENMRREGYEMEVSKPEVVIKTVDGVKNEPVEEVFVVVPQEYQGIISQEFGRRYGTLVTMDTISDTEIEFIYHMPSRAALGLRSQLLTLTKGTIVYNTQVIGWEKIGQPLPRFRRGVLLASQAGDAVAYGIHAAQARGITFVDPGTKVYEGMIVGQNAKEGDMEVNICRGKKLTNMRSKSSDGIIQLTPALHYSLEQSLEFLEGDELLEITPRSLRLRKKLLTDIDRRRKNRGENPRSG